MGLGEMGHFVVHSNARKKNSIKIAKMGCYLIQCKDVVSHMLAHGRKKYIKQTLQKKKLKWYHIYRNWRKKDSCLQ
jgi:hypothetical protein